MEPICDFIGDVPLRDYRPVIDDLCSAGSVVISPLFKNTEPLRSCIREDAASPGSFQHTRQVCTIVLSTSSRVQARGSRHRVCRCYGVSLSEIRIFRRRKSFVIV
jgi:hypothetical protein